MSDLELCTVCDQETGKAGRSEDSLYNHKDDGPFCELCFAKEVIERNEELQAEVAKLRENQTSRREPHNLDRQETDRCS